MILELTTSLTRIILQQNLKTNDKDDVPSYDQLTTQTLEPVWVQLRKPLQDRTTEVQEKSFSHKTAPVSAVS